MPRDFDLNSQKWLTLIFEDKNREYGAYVQRDESSNRHLQAMMIITLLALGLIFLPGLIKSVIPEPVEDFTEMTELKTTILDLQDQVPEENIIKAIEMPPPPELKATVAFVAPKIVEDEKVSDESLMLTQQELTETRAEISVATVEGSLDSGVNIADLRDHQVVVEEEAKIEIFQHVEVMPQFPGGDAALLDWLGKNIIYPTIAAEQGIQGRVSLRFVVKPDGSIGDIEIQRSLDPSCDKEAMRAVGKMPKWIPGKQNGNPVHVYYSLPVVFRLQNQ